MNLSLILSLALSHALAGPAVLLSTKASPTESVAASRTLLRELLACPTPCEIRIGTRAFTLETPALGQGERGVVFRLLGADAGQVLKISKPDPRSLEILRDEAVSHRFWSEQAQGAFRVGTRQSTHPSGLFAVMSEVRGEPLTDALFKLGLLELDPVLGDVRARRDHSHVAPEDLARLWRALARMIAVVKQHPEMRTSLSPNNFYVSWKSDGTLGDIHLIDLGTDARGDQRYFELKNISDYLALSAEKIQGYLKKPGFLGADLWALQEQARQRHGLPALFDLEEHRPQLLELARKLRPGARVEAVPTREILDWPVPSQATPRVSADGVTAMAPTRVRDLALLAAFLNQALAGEGPAVELRLGADVIRIKRPALGQGDRGIVFAIEGSDEVIKIPKPNLISVLALMGESAGYEFWRGRSLRAGSGFSVPERRVLHELGVYSLMARDHGEPLTKAMLRFGLLSFDPSTSKAYSHPDRIAAMSGANREKIEHALRSMLALMKTHPEMSLSISPNNLHINYANAQRTVISSVVLIDVGLSSKASAKFDSIKDLSSYVEFSRDRLEKYLRVGYSDREISELNEKVSQGQCRRVFLAP